ncbi:protein yippee-like At3g11230 [Octopus sinensis]|uniref:Protein yippee-like n=1 Tax=Octopus sinensis TaxID=2607531 RepID=A0A6P7TQN0_9MOLL|nr:protein yippee-like At3g11230 [Octopus sinensis]
MAIRYFIPPNSSYFYECKKCLIPFANLDDITSAEFTRRGIKSYQFSKVVNIKFGKIFDTNIRSKHYLIQNAYCSGCLTKVGWRYEFTFNDEEQHKEDMTIINKAYVIHHVDPNCKE